MGGRGNSGSRNQGSSDVVSSKQQDYEDRIRNSDIEHGAFLDKDGNILLEAHGTVEGVNFGETWDDEVAFNHEVEQRVWNDEEVNFTHNHPENTIFSPEDIEALDALEHHSERAVLPNGTTYTLIREQPRTSNVIIIDTNTGESKREFEPKKLAPAYDKEYTAIWNPGWEKIKRETSYGSKERAKAIEALDKEIATHMEKWLSKNAKNYGYRFVVEKRRKS